MIRLDTGWQLVARMLSEQRYATNRGMGVTNGRIGKQSDEDTDLNGIGGELAFCLAANCCPDLSVSPRRGGADCVTPDGVRWDVKTSSHENARLIATLSKRLQDADAYVLIVGTFPLYRVAGWAWASELLTPGNITDLGYGRTYALAQDKLRTFTEEKIK